MSQTAAIARVPFAPAARLEPLPQPARVEAPVRADRFERAPAVAKVRAEAPMSDRQRAFIAFGPAFEDALDQATGTEVQRGNAVEPLFDGVTSFAARKQLIESAKHTIHLQTFIFDDDATGKETAALLCAAARRGVKVRVIYDALGSNRAANALFDMMRAAGVEVRGYGKILQEPWTANHRWHEKLLIVDSTQAITGGMNLANEYAYGGSRRLVRSRSAHPELPWRDVDVLVSGPVLRAFEVDFEGNWGQLGPGYVESAFADLMTRVPSARPTGSDVRFVQNDPGAGENRIEDTLWYAITSAQKTITIETAYFVPTPAMREALLDARARGVQVRILTNSPKSNDLPLSQPIARSFYKELLSAGVEIHEKRGGTLHSKSFSFDGISVRCSSRS